MSRTLVFTMTCACLAIPSGCNTIKKVNALLDEAKATTQKAGKVADQVPNMVDDATTKATDSMTQSVSALGGVPAVGRQFTGGTDIGRRSQGRGGQLEEDLDGDGVPEDVNVFVDDREQTFLGFEIARPAGEAGRDCYASWLEANAVWTVITECGDHPEGELVDICNWPEAGGALECVALTCSGDECVFEFCYDELDEIPCSFDPTTETGDDWSSSGANSDPSGDSGTGGASETGDDFGTGGETGGSTGSDWGSTSGD